MNRHVLVMVSTVVLAISSAAAAIAADPVKVPAVAAAEHDVRRGPGVTSMRKLSDYLPALTGTAGDTDVYILDSGVAGGTALVAGGTHGNEVAGIITAVLLVERARVQQGRLIVIPHANNSAVAWLDTTDPLRGAIDSFTLRTPSGERRFKLGTRLTNPEHQGQPDPARYQHPGSADTLSGAESRNLDRAYPGRPDGTLTERIACGIMQVLKSEKVDLAFDLHESGPESRLSWMIVAHPKNLELAAGAVLALEVADVSMKLERSSDTFRGLSHREWGDATQARAFLLETANPAMGNQARGGDPINEATLPLVRRVAVHLAAVRAVLEAYEEEAPAARRIRLAGLPTVPEMEKAGVGAFLK